MTNNKHVDLIKTFIIILSLIASCSCYEQPVLLKEPLDLYGIENEPLTLSCRATGDPTPTYIWYRNNKEINLNSDTRLKSTKDGDLIIEKFNPDEDQGKYYCLVRVDAPDIELKLISRTADIKASAFPQTFKKDIKEVTGYGGGAIRLSVDTSNFDPAPQIGWNYRGKPTIRNDDPRFYVLPNGVLQIAGLTSADEGEIRAIARSRKSKKTITGRFAKINIADATTRSADKDFYFIGKPTDQQIMWGQSVIIEALADSSNTVSYAWYKDGAAIKLDSKMSIVGQGNLKILYADENDAGEYTVVASSNGKTIQAASKLTIMTSPEILQAPPKKVYTMEGKNARFDFSVDGSPPPKFNWYHDGIIVDASADYIELGSDYLIVKECIAADAGIYQLRVKNSFGETQVSSELIVTPEADTTVTPTTVPLPGKVTQLKAYSPSPTEITLSWTKPSGSQITGYEIIYQRPGGSFIINKYAPTATTATINGLNPGTSYNFKIQAVNNVGTGPVSDIVTIRTMDKPKPPAAVTSIRSSFSGSTMVLNWDPPSGAPRPDRYDVYYIDEANDATAKILKTNDLSIEIPNLTPGNTYKYWIVPYNKDTKGPESQKYIVEIPDPSNKPPGPIFDLTANPIDTTSINLEWEKPKSEPTPTSYQIFYRNLDDLSLPLQKQISTTTQLTIQNLSPNTVYEFQITPYNNDIKGPRSSLVEATTFPEASKPPGPINDFVANPVDTTVISLKWEEPNSGPTPTSYKVIYRNLDDLSLPPQTKITANTNLAFQNLSPYTLYEFQVIPYNKETEGPKSMLVKIKTLAQAPPAPTNIQPVTRASKSVKVKWDPISSFGGTLNSYTLQIFETESPTNSMREITDILKSSTEWTIENLKPDTKYTIFVKAVGEDGKEGPQSQSFTLKTRTVTKQGPSAASGFQGVHPPNQPYVIKYIWEEPKLITGQLDSYIFYYKKDGDTSWNTKILPGNVNEFFFSDFDLGQTYDSYVVAVDENGEGKESNQAIVPSMKENMAPPPIIQLAVVPKTDSLSLTWQPPPLSSNVIVRGYYVVVKEKNTNKVIFNEKIIGRDRNKLVLYNGIKPNTEYDVEVRAYNNAGSGTDVKKSSATLSAPNPAIIVTNVDKESKNVNFKWIDTKNKGSTPVEYIVRYTTPNNDGQPTIVTTNPYVNVDGLTPYTDYKFYVKRKGDADFALDATVDTKTSEAVPSKPLNVIGRAVAKYPTWMMINWDVPSSPNGRITKYIVKYSKTKDLPVSKWPMMETKGPVTSLNVTGLDTGTNYHFVVNAVNGAGIGAVSDVYTAGTGGVYVPGGLPLSGGGGVIIVPDGEAHPHSIAHGFDFWWIILFIVLLIVLIILLLLLIYFCCCRKKGSMERCWACCPCCKSCWYSFCLPCCLICCPCCCKKKKKAYGEEAFILTADGGKKNGHAEIIPLTAVVDGSVSGSAVTAGSISRRSSKSSVSNIKVPVPGDITFISYKTSLQDYCQKVGWLAPVYATNQSVTGCDAKVSFGGSTYDSGTTYVTTRQEAEQRAAHAALIGLHVLENGSGYQGDACIAVPSPGDASFISYKCSLHDFCQQCNILPPRFATSKHETGFTSQVTVGSHTFNMPGRVSSTHEAEQKAAYIGLLGLCMTDSKATYHPEACFTVSGPGDANFISFKSSLHDFCQRYKLPPPQYKTNQDAHGYTAKLKFGGLFFQSSDFFETRLESEQHAAYEALQGLGLLESSVDFVATTNTSNVNGSISGSQFGGSFVTVGSIGGNMPPTYSRQASRTGSRQPSRSASKPASRSGSRPGSRSGSRRGSFNYLDDVINTSYLGSTATYATPSVDQNVNMGQRSYSASHGLDDHRTRLDSNTAVYTTVGRSGNSTPRSNINQYQGFHEAGMNNTSTLNTGYTSNNSTSSRYANSSVGSSSNIHNINPVGSTNITATISGIGSSPQDKTQTYEKKEEHKTEGNNSTFSYTINYEHHTTTNGSTSATLPRRHLQLPTTGSSYNEFSSASNQNRSYSSVHNVNQSKQGFGSSTLRAASSHPAMPDLEMEMAGLEGLIKDLNGITNINAKMV